MPETEESERIRREERIEQKILFLVDHVGEMRGDIKALLSNKEEAALQRQKFEGRLDVLEAGIQQHERRLSELEIYKLNFSQVSTDMQEIKDAQKKAADEAAKREKELRERLEEELETKQHLEEERAQRVKERTEERKWKLAEIVFGVIVTLTIGALFAHLVWR